MHFQALPALVLVHLETAFLLKVTHGGGVFSGAKCVAWAGVSSLFPYTAWHPAIIG
jgi:hypothetical protein